MNRKMRAKLNNEAARRKRNCPSQGKMVAAAPEQTHCDRCGEELGTPVAVLVLGGGEALLDKKQLN